MAVFELKTEIAVGDVERMVEVLLAELEEQRLMVIEDKPSNRAWVSGYFGSADEGQEAWRRLAVESPSEGKLGQPEVREMPDTDWKNSYKAHFKASKFGRLNWVPVWERETFALPIGEEVLWLDPGMAFGTGNHETTRLCCERLSDLSNDGSSRLRVIDAGCGSGILALSAAKLGFRDIVGFDLDPEALRVSEENAALNGLAGRVQFSVGDLVSGLAGREAELVLANIQADVLVNFAPQLIAAVAPDGRLVLSGILATELESVRAVFLRFAPAWVSASRSLGEWSDLYFCSSADLSG